MESLPKLFDLYELGVLSYIDLAFAEQFHSEDEELASLYCYLLLAMRSGHLCVQVEGSRMVPDIKELILNESDLLKDLIVKGAEKLEDCCPSSIIREGNFIYLQKNWHLETQCIDYLQKLLADVPNIEMDLKEISVPMNQEQKEAIKAAASQCFTVICGGPGTGKTYTAGNLISLLIQSSEEIEVVLAAPTGKAAAHLQSSMQRTLSTPLKALTLHHLLGVNKWNKSQEEGELSADVILVDESSMIDAHMMVRLLGSVKKGGRLILLGDPQQLPPVEKGHLFNDMIDELKANTATKKHVLTLKECLRAENEELIELAEYVQRGQCQAALHCLCGLSEAVNRFEGDPLEYISSHFSYLDKLEANDPEILRKANQFRALSPFRKGHFGVWQINQWVQEHRKRKKSVFFPIVLTHHAKDLGLYNGDTGLLVLDEENPFALFEDQNLSVRRISLFLLPQFEFAYCLSVHKSQGSEFNHVFLCLPEGSEMFGRQSFYTAITRAKQKLCVWGSEATIEQIIRKKTIRISGLERRFSLESNQLT